MKAGRRKVHSPEIVFVCCRPEDLPIISRHGIDVPEIDILSSLRDDRARAATALLVALPTGPPEGGLLRLKPSEILNADPYRPPRQVTAAGGVLTRIVRGRTQVLLILRRGVWDLPKGKQDRGETVPECAVREVNEELGIADATLVSPMGRTRHGYADGRRYLVKTTHWYLMSSASERFVPQATEQISAVGWFHVPDALRHLGFEPLRALLLRHEHLFADPPVTEEA